MMMWWCFREYCFENRRFCDDFVVSGRFLRPGQDWESLPFSGHCGLSWGEGWELFLPHQSHDHRDWFEDEVLDHVILCGRSGVCCGTTRWVRGAIICYINCQLIGSLWTWRLVWSQDRDRDSPEGQSGIGVWVSGIKVWTEEAGVACMTLLSSGPLCGDQAALWDSLGTQRGQWCLGTFSWRPFMRLIVVYRVLYWQREGSVNTNSW